MIRLHSPFERIVMVSPERITHVKPDHERPERTRVYFDNDYITVMESVEEVARKVLEWKLAMEQYRAYTNEAVTKEIGTHRYAELIDDIGSVWRKLLQLAGLEKPNHERD